MNRPKPRNAHQGELHALLAETINKHDALLQSPDWTPELIPRSVPVLWFGDASTARRRIMTLGANPSRSEFLKGRHGQLLEGDAARFFVRDDGPVAGQNLDLDAIAESFDRYFEKRPYRSWFGKQDGGKVEALMNGMGASFYSKESEYAGLHIDLFPFATHKDFGHVAGLAQRDLFADKWAHGVLTRLINILSPSALVITGRGNFNHVIDHFGDLVGWSGSGAFTTSTGMTTEVHRGEIVGLTIPVAAISVNLGNPVGWSRMDIVELGGHVAQTLGLKD